MSFTTDEIHSLWKIITMNRDNVIVSFPGWFHHIKRGTFSEHEAYRDLSVEKEGKIRKVVIEREKKYEVRL